MPCPSCKQPFTRDTAIIDRATAEGKLSYCSRRCANLVHRRKAKVAKLECTECKRPFERLQRLVDGVLRKGKTNFFCSKQCSTKHHWKLHPAPKVKLKCMGCKRMFERSPFEMELRKKRGIKIVACCVACANRVAKLKPPVLLVCDRCGKKFKRHGSLIKRAERMKLKHTYCSRECTNNKPKNKGQHTKSWRVPSTAHCAYCKQRFKIDRGGLKRRMAQNDGVLYCSKECAGFNGKGNGSGTLKRRTGMTDEEWYWFKRLSDEGLGEWVGSSGALVYGEEYDQGAAGQKRKEAAGGV